MHKAKSNKELWAFLFNDFLLLTHTSKQFTSSGPDKLFSNKNNIQLKMYKPVSLSANTQPARSVWWYGRHIAHTTTLFYVLVQPDI
jgi:hypothetical protein